MRDFNIEYKKIYELVFDDVERVKEFVLSEISQNNIVSQRLAEYFSAPSKHIRAVLSFLYLRSMNIAIDDNQILYQAVIELIHNASLIHDDVIDDLYHVIKKDLVEKIRETTEGETILDYLLIAKYIERIGDHATNIAEWVIFALTGERG